MPLTTPANPLDAMILTGPGFLDTYRKAHEIMLADPHIGLYCVDSLNDDRYDKAQPHDFAMLPYGML